MAGEAAMAPPRPIQGWRAFGGAPSPDDRSPTIRAFLAVGSSPDQIRLENGVTMAR